MTLQALLRDLSGDDVELVLSMALTRELYSGAGRPASDVFIEHRNLLYRGPRVGMPRLGWSATFGWRPCCGPTYRSASWGVEVCPSEAIEIMQNEINYGRFAL